MVIDGHRWWARVRAGEFDDLGLNPGYVLPWACAGTILRRLPAGEIADYEVVVDGDGPVLWRTHCYHRDELSKA